MRFVVGARGWDAGAQRSACPDERRGGLESSCRRRVGSAATGGSSRRAVTTYRVVLGREGPCGRDTASPARRMGTGRLGFPHASAHRRAMVMTRQQRVTPSCCRRCCGGLAPYGSRWWVVDVARHQRNLEAGDAQRRYRRMLLRNQPTTLAATRQARPGHALAGALRPPRTPPQRRDRGRGLPSAARYALGLAWAALNRSAVVMAVLLAAHPTAAIDQTNSEYDLAGWARTCMVPGNPKPGHSTYRQKGQSQISTDKSLTEFTPSATLRLNVVWFEKGRYRYSIAGIFPSTSFVIT